MSSVSGRLSDGLKTVVAGIGLTPTPTIRQRKQPIVADGETPPLILVAVGGAQDFEPAFKGGWFVKYAASVAIAFPAGGKLKDNVTLREWLDQVWPALADWRNLLAAGVPEINSVMPRVDSIFDMSALSKAYDWAFASITAETLEKRY